MDVRSVFKIRWLALAVIFITFAASLRAADKEPGGLSILRTRHYRIHSDLDRDTTEDLARRMDSMYDEYDRRWAAFRTGQSAPALEVYVFRKQDDYVRFTGDRWRNSGGVFMPTRNLLAAFLEGQGHDALRRTLQHEAFHQFAHRTISPDLPIWLNEGLAQLFEEGIWTGEGFWLGQVPPRRLRQLVDDIDKRRLLSFDKMLALTPEQWITTLRGDRNAGITQYNQSWAMVHYLVHAKDVAGKEKHRARLIKMLELLHNGTKANDAFVAAFSANVKGFQDRFVEYANALTATPEASMVERQEVLADFVISLKKEGRTFKDIAALKQFVIATRFSIQYTDRGITWSTEPDVTKYFADMSNKALKPKDLYFSARPGAILPDIICRPNEKLQLRTRFHLATSGKRQIEHEVVVEAPNRQARADE